MVGMGWDLGLLFFCQKTKQKSNTILSTLAYFMHFSSLVVQVKVLWWLNSFNILFFNGCL